MRKMNVVLSACVLLLVISGGVSAHAKVQARYTDCPDDKAIVGGGQHNTDEPENVVRTYAPDGLGPGYPEDLIDYNFLGGQIDALAHGNDQYFSDLLANRVDLLISVTGDSDHKCVFRESRYGERGLLWDHNDFSNCGLVYDEDLTDVDALEVYGEGGPDYPRFFSLEGDPPYGEPPWSTCVFHYADGTFSTYVARDFVYIELEYLGWSGHVTEIDVDALMVLDRGVEGIWDQDDIIIFSIRASGGWDGGEIVVMPYTGLSSYFLEHGGHPWNTSFNVTENFGVTTPEVDAIEAYKSEEVLTLTQWGIIALLLVLAGFGIINLHWHRKALAVCSR